MLRWVKSFTVGIRALIALLLQFVIGLVSFILLLVGFSLGMSLSFLLIGIPILLISLMATRATAWLHLKVIGGLLRTDTPSYDPRLFRFEGENLWQMLVNDQRDPRTRLSLGAVWALFPTGILALMVFVLGVIAFALEAPFALLFGRKMMSANALKSTAHQLSGLDRMSAQFSRFEEDDLPVLSKPKRDYQRLAEPLEDESDAEDTALLQKPKRSSSPIER
jgi:hypothetical protein